MDGNTNYGPEITMIIKQQQQQIEYPTILLE